MCCVECFLRVYSSYVLYRTGLDWTELSKDEYPACEAWEEPTTVDHDAGGCHVESGSYGNIDWRFCEDRDITCYFEYVYRKEVEFLYLPR